MITYYYKNIRSKKLQILEKYKAGTWVYVEAPDETELDLLEKEFKLDKSLLLDALDEDEMPRIETEEGNVYMYTRYTFVDNTLQIATCPILFIVSKDVFITISRSKFARLDKFVSGSKLDFTTTQRTKLLLQILDQIVDQYEIELNGISRRIKTIRSRLRVEEIRNRDFIDFVLIEDILNEFLSALLPTNAILRRLLLGKHIKLFDEDKDIIEDLLLNNEQSIEGCKSSLKTIVNIREAYSTIMSNNLNRIIRVLTVITVVLSIPTLIASIYGMNVALPYDHSPLAFVGIIVVSLAVSIGMTIYLRIQRWL